MPDPGRIEALEGSRITLEVATTAPVRTIDVEWPRTSVPVAVPPGGNGKTGSVTLGAEASGPYRIRLLDRRGLTTVDFRVGDVRVLDFADDTFDVVHAHQVLQHVVDPVAALAKAAQGW